MVYSLGGDINFVDVIAEVLQGHTLAEIIIGADNTDDLALLIRWISAAQPGTDSKKHWSRVFLKKAEPFLL